MDITNVVIEPTHPEHPKEPQQLPGEPPPGPWELLFQEWRLALDEKMFHAVRSAFDRSFILIDEEEPIDADQSRILYSLTDRTFLEHYV